jgi:hypothetical protein
LKSPWGESKADRKKRQTTGHPKYSEIPLPDAPKKKERKPGDPPDIVSDSKCCVDDFVYPSLWYSFTTRKKIGIHFEAEAIFSKQEGGVPVPGADPESPGSKGPGDGSPGGTVVVQKCACKCCEFEQLVDAVVRTEKDAEPEALLQAYDCVWFDTSDPKDVLHVGGRPQTDRDGNPSLIRVHGPGDEAPRDPTTGDLKSTVRFICPGRRGDAWALGYLTSIKSNYSEGDCKYFFCDETSVPKAILKTGWLYSATFTGRIVDICNGREIKRQDSFLAMITESGAMVRQEHGSTPGNAPRIPPSQKQQDRTTEDSGCK